MPVESKKALGLETHWKYENAVTLLDHIRKRNKMDVHYLWSSESIFRCSYQVPYALSYLYTKRPKKSFGIASPKT